MGECGVQGVGNSGEGSGPPADAGGGVDVDYEEIGGEADEGQGYGEVGLEDGGG